MPPEDDEALADIDIDAEDEDPEAIFASLDAEAADESVTEAALEAAEAILERTELETETTWRVAPLEKVLPVIVVPPFPPLLDWARTLVAVAARRKASLEKCMTDAGNVVGICEVKRLSEKDLSQSMGIQTLVVISKPTVLSIQSSGPMKSIAITYIHGQNLRCTRAHHRLSTFPFSTRSLNNRRIYCKALG